MKKSNTLLGILAGIATLASTFNHPTQPINPNVQHTLQKSINLNTGKYQDTLLGTRIDIDKDGKYDAFAIASPILNPHLYDVLAEYRRLGKEHTDIIREGWPGVEIYLTPETNKLIQENPNIRQSLSNYIPLNNIIPKEIPAEKLEEAYKGKYQALLPQEHFTLIDDRFIPQCLRNNPEERIIELTAIAKKENIFFDIK